MLAAASLGRSVAGHSEIVPGEALRRTAGRVLVADAAECVPNDSLALGTLPAERFRKLGDLADAYVRLDAQ